MFLINQHVYRVGKCFSNWKCPYKKNMSVRLTVFFYHDDTVLSSPPRNIQVIINNKAALVMFDALFCRILGSALPDQVYIRVLLAVLQYSVLQGRLGKKCSSLQEKQCSYFFKVVELLFFPPYTIWTCSAGLYSLWLNRLALSGVCCI